MRIRNEMATGMAMMMNVHDTHAVLWAVRKRVEGMKYTGMGTARDRMAKRKIVTGNPKERGHLIKSFVSQAEAALSLHHHSLGTATTYQFSL